MKTVLALDVATKTGHALRRADGRIESGVIDLSMRKGETSGHRWLKLNRWLVDLHACHPLDEVHFEDCVILSGPGQTQTARVYGGFVATLEAFCARRDIPTTLHRIGTWKKLFTGNGAAKKPEIIAVCQQLGFKPADDNEADAIGILHVAIRQCPLLTPPPGKAPRFVLRFPEGRAPF